MVLPRPPLEVGDASTGLRLYAVRLQGHTLLLRADVLRAAQSTLQVETPWRLLSAEGATAGQGANGTVTVRFFAPQAPDGAGSGPSAITLVFATRADERNSARTP